MWEASLDPAHVKQVAVFLVKVSYHIPGILKFSLRNSGVNISEVYSMVYFFPGDALSKK